MRLSPDATDRWVHTYNGAVMPMLRGDLAEAEAAAEAAFTLGTDSGQPDAMTFFAAQLVDHPAPPGPSPRDDPRHRTGRSSTSRTSALIELSWRSPTHGKATRPAPPDSWMPTRRTGSPSPRTPRWSTAHACWAEAAARGWVTTECARVMRERMAPFHTQLVTTTCYILPTLAHYLGRVDHLLGRYDDAERMVRRGDAAPHPPRVPLLIAYTNAAWAAMLADRDHPDDRTQAREKAQHALAAATTGGYGYIEADARAVLDRTT